MCFRPADATLGPGVAAIRWDRAPDGDAGTLRLASAWTTLHLQDEQEVAQLLGIPSTCTAAALLPVARLTGGDLKPAKRLPVEEVTYWGKWGQWRE
ncbi:MAG: hypothetical protein AB7O21_06680 [Gammaproteobacteria bacterium]